MKNLSVIADDLSGAFETAAVLGPRARIVRLGAETFPTLDTAASDGAPLVIDTGTRETDGAHAGAALEGLLPLLRRRNGPVLKKLDSLLRGPVEAELSALAGLGTIILAPAAPGLGRVVVDGVVLVNGEPLGTTGAWHREALHGRSIPHRVEDVAPSLTPASLSLNQLRSLDVGDLHQLLAALARSTRLIIVDAETDEDLRHLARSSQTHDDGPAFVLAGAAALTAATVEPAGTTALQPQRLLVPGADEPAHRPVAVVVGTPDPAASAQADALEREGVTPVLFEPGTALQEPTPGDWLVRIDPTANVVAPSALTADLGRAVASVVGDRDLVLTGGETAASVLGALGLATFTSPSPVLNASGTPVPGLVRVIAVDGRRIITKPGSHGDDAALLDALHHLRGDVAPAAGVVIPTRKASTMALPTIGITMGDAAGVGPEICVAAVLDPSVADACTPVVIGDAARLRDAARVLGVDADINVIENPEDAVHQPGTLDVIDLGLIPEDLPYGHVSALAGDAAYQYVAVAARLANEHRIQAICTAPLNKEALHLGGHRYPGHTELLAYLTGTKEVSMMLSTPKLKVIHVTTHIGLIDAVARIEPGLVERTILRGHQALTESGIASPRIGVAAINPHAGENGLFGYGEEAEKIAPGVEAARAAGVDAVGPLPADTLFFLAGRGDYDLVVAMYHDQGHGPIKVLGIEAGVNITVGLPAPRTSVDHGTAFDIAGQGKVDTRSMVEAMRQAIELAPSPAA